MRVMPAVEETVREYPSEEGSPDALRYVVVSLLRVRKIVSVVAAEEVPLTTVALIPKMVLRSSAKVVAKA